eukprot:5001499-Alexandrium_andersonii.AAC.1
MARSGAGRHPLAVGARPRGSQGPRRARVPLGVLVVPGLQAPCRPSRARRGRQAGPAGRGPLRRPCGQLR